MSAEIGSPAPEFTLFDQTRQPVTLESLKGGRALVVFIPFPFTGVCTGEVCELRDNLSQLGSLDAKVVVITPHAIPTNAKWAELEDLTFPILSDFWPHGAVAQAYGTFNEKLGTAHRSTFVLDADGVITDILRSGGLGEARNYDDYVAALS